MQNEDSLSQPTLPIMVISKDKLHWRKRTSQKADNIKSAWKNALEVATVRDGIKKEPPSSDETGEQRKQRCVDLFVF